MKESLLKYLETKDLFSKTDNILVAVSGGLDSVVLLDLLFKTGFSISIAHCNFQLRGSESDTDEEFVKSIGENYNLGTFIKTCNAAEFAKTNKISIQESARELRYKWFEEVLTENKFDKLAVAHHFDDNLETFFINLSRGSGLSGLKGIPVKNNKIVRPLMFATRKEIENYAKENNLVFREDSSNSSDKYLRNNLRHNLLPVLHNILGNSNEALQKSMDYLAEDELLFNKLLDDKRSDFLEKVDGVTIIDKSKLLSLSPLKTWVFYLLKPFNFNRTICDDISSAILDNQSGKTFFSETHRLITDREKLLISKNIASKQSEFIIEKNDSEISVPLIFNISTLAKTSNFKIEKSKNTAYFDFDKLKFPLVLRKWGNGDNFHPFGMKGSKLLSDYFIDEKLNLLEKENAWLLVSGEEIIWVVGMRTSEKFKISDKTKVVYQIKTVSQN